MARDTFSFHFALLIRPVSNFAIIISAFSARFVMT